MKPKLPLSVRAAVIAFVLGVIVPYVSYKLQSDDPCMPKEAGMFYIPVLVPIFELCPMSFIGELGLLTVGLPAVISSLAVIAMSEGALAYGTTDLFCVLPLLMSFGVYVVVVVIVRRLTRNNSVG